MTTYDILTTDSAGPADRVRVYRSGVLVAEVSADEIVRFASALEQITALDGHTLLGPDSKHRMGDDARSAAVPPSRGRMTDAVAARKRG